MKTFELAYTIEEEESWRGKDKIKIKSNLSDDEMIECRLAKSLVETLRTESSILEPDKLILAIAEAQKRDLKNSLEAMDDMAIQAKVHADKAHEILSNSAKDAEKKYADIEKNFSDVEKRFKDKMISTSASIKTHLEKLKSIEERLTKIDNWKLEKLSEALQQIVKLAENDPELVKLVLDYKTKDI